MTMQHPKAVRRRILELLYARYMANPLDMPGPRDILEDGTLSARDLAVHAHYLSDRGLVELMMGYNPPMFAAVRLTADGVDLVENRFEFNLRFPASPDALEEAAAPLPLLVEQLVEEAEFSPLDGEARRCLLRDVQYLRDELARPVARWRGEVIEAVLAWMAGPFDDPGEALPSLARIQEAVARCQIEERNWTPESGT